MEYKIRRAYIKNDGSIEYAKRATSTIYPQKLKIGGLYFLHPGKLYKVEDEIKED